MAKKEKNLLEWLTEFENGAFTNPDFDTQVEAGWYDWFCKDESLAKKTIKLGKKLKMIVNSPKINPTTSYVFFKNNCPLNGSLYDDFRICDIESHDVIYTITPKCGHKSSEGLGQVYGRENNFDGPLIEGKWSDIKKWFNN